MLQFIRKKSVLFLLHSLSFLILISCAIKPPVEKGVFRDSNLVELIKLDTTFILDVKYATSNNFIGKQMYDEARVFLQKPAADALIKVNAELKKLGYGLILFDGYRPWSVTKTFWDLTPRKEKNFVANPKNGSRHNRGCAIDLTLYNLATKKQVQMPGEYDEASERSYPNYIGGTAKQREMRDLLIKTMEANGFTVYKFEWWHFDYIDWQHYRIQNIQFSDIN